MPVVRKLMDSLVERYGPEEGKRVYYAMEAEGKGPFGPKGKHHDLHEAWAAKNGAQPNRAAGKKKPPTSRKSGARRRSGPGTRRG